MMAKVDQRREGNEAGKKKMKAKDKRRGREEKEKRKRRTRESIGKKERPEKRFEDDEGGA
jgi:hypothetical protein